MSDEARPHLEQLFTGLEGFVALGVGFGGHRNGNGTYEFRSFAENFFHWPEQADAIIETAAAYAPEADVYVCPLFRAGSARARRAQEGSVASPGPTSTRTARPGGTERSSARQVVRELGARATPVPLAFGGHLPPSSSV